MELRVKVRGLVVRIILIGHIGKQKNDITL